MNALIAAGSVLAIVLLVFSMWLDDKRHVDCGCPPEEDPSFIWYPVRWGLLTVQVLVFMSNVVYAAGNFYAANVDLLKDFCVVALGVTYALTLINPRWSVTIIVELLRRKVRGGS